MKYTWIIVLLGMVACRQAEPVTESARPVSQADQILFEMARTYLFPLPKDAADEEHPLSPELVKLGRALYLEKGLSKDGTVSCNSCHPLDQYGVNDTPLSEGIGHRLGARNSPTTFNAALYLAQFWDGRAKTVEEQVEGPLLNPVEMGMPSKKAVVRRLRADSQYVALFAQAFPSSKEINFTQVARAIGAFERTLMTPSRLDKYLEGDVGALTEKEKSGLKNMLDFGCIPCHSGATMGGAMYQKFGLFADYRSYTGSRPGDQGRLSVTHQSQDEDVYKVPSLRNITHTAPYFHDGSVDQLEEAVRVMAQLQLGRELTDEQVEDIVAFLEVSSDWSEEAYRNLGRTMEKSKPKTTQY